MANHQTSSAPRAPRSDGDYRPDVDGLRAVAVLAVVAYHAFPDAFTDGGFIGVDVFFVISGFLISSIIFRSLDRGTFTFAGFYARRVRRIFPALIVVLASVYLIGWLCLLSDEFERLGKHITAGAAFVSNLALWRESGYFDPAADTKPLLHLWSLGIEEQFYILWPLALWLLWRRRARALAFILLATGLSFVWSVVLCATNKTAAFYAPQSRFWELALGAVLAHVALSRNDPGRPGSSRWVAALSRCLLPSGATRRGLQSVLGAVLLATGLVAVTPDGPFPGAWALFPTVGTLLLIGAGRSAWVNRYVLSRRPMVWIGLVSYPLYLWHWPLITFARIMHGGLPGLRVRGVLVAVSILLAWLTFLLLERPIRRRPGWVVIVTLAASMCAVAGVAVTAWARGGLPFRRVNALNPAKRSGADGGDGGHLLPGCGLSAGRDQELVGLCAHDGRQPIRFALLGDSKAAALYGGLARTSEPCGRWVVIGGMIPVLSDQDIYREHQAATRSAVQAVVQNPQIEKVAIVTAARALFQLSNDYSIADLPASPNRPAALAGLANVLRALTGAGKQVVLVVDNPTLPDPRNCIGRRTGSDLLNELMPPAVNPGCDLPLARHLQLSQPYRSMLGELAAAFPGRVAIFDTTPYLCDVEAGTCPPFKGARLLYSYTDHISEFAATLIGRDLNHLMCYGE